MIRDRADSNLSEEDIEATLAAAARHGVDPEVAIQAVRGHFDPAQEAAEAEVQRPRQKRDGASVARLGCAGALLLALLGLMGVWPMFKLGLAVIVWLLA